MLLLSLLSCPAPTDLWIGGDLHRGALTDSGLDTLLGQLGRYAGPLVVNLEGPVAEAAPPDVEVALFNVPALLPALRAARVAAVGIDNNHTGGAESRTRTEAAVRAAGLMPLGDSPTGVWSFGTGPRVIQLDVSGADTTARLAALGPHPGPFDLVVLLHATGPASYLPSPPLRAAVDLAIATGADVVASHGTHAIGPVERRGGTVIAWGLGNLVFNCACTTETDGLLLHVDHDRAEIWPVRAGMMGAPAHLAPDPDAVFDLLEAIGSSPIERHGSWAEW